MPKRGSQLLLNETIQDYMGFCSSLNERIDNLQENGFLRKSDVTRLLKEFSLDYFEGNEPKALFFHKSEEDQEELISESLERIDEEEDFKVELSILFLKRAKVMQLDREQLESIFRFLSGGREDSITRDSFAESLAKMPALRLKENILAKMIEMAGSLPFLRLNFYQLFIISGWIDQRIKQLDSTVAANTKKRKRSKKT
jgi:hypothetical protein